MGSIPQWSTEPSGGAKIGKFKFNFLVRIWVIGCVMNLSGQDNAHLLYTKGWESARFLFDSDTGFLFFLETPKSLTNPSQILLTLIGCTELVLTNVDKWHIFLVS